MKVWGAIFNLISVVLLAIMLMVINNIADTNARQFEEIRLSYATDYAVEAAFRSSVATDSIGTDYTGDGLDAIKINPTLVLDTFYNVMCLSYNMSPSAENFSKLEQSVATGALCTVDGYYILEPIETDSDEDDVVLGGEAKLSWGVKRPYLVYNDDGRLFSASLVSERTTEYNNRFTGADGQESLIYRMTYAGDTGEDADKHRGGTGLTSAKVEQAISSLLTTDINYAIYARNIQGVGGTVIKSFYMPSSDSLTAVNTLKSPTLLLFLQDSSFLNGYHLDTVSVGGSRVKSKTNIIGFREAGSTDLYYCYAGQQMGEPGVTVIERFDTLHAAAKAGYKPHIVFLNKPLSKK